MFTNLTLLATDVFFFHWWPVRTSTVRLMCIFLLHCYFHGSSFVFMYVFICILTSFFLSPAMLSQKDKEIDELKSKIAEVMAVMPVTSSPNCYSPNPPAISLASGIVSSLLYTPKYNMGEEKVAKSNLDPNASVYTPKVARLTSESEI